MIDYRKPNEELIFDLIEESNPGFRATYDVTKIKLSVPTAITVDPQDPYRRDTSVVVTGAAGSNIVGRQTIQYRRINLRTLMNGMTTLLSREYYSADRLPPAVWRATVNRLLGTNIPATSWSTTFDCINSANWVPGQPSSQTFTMLTTDLCYVGNVGLTWVKGKRTVVDLLTPSPVIAGRQWPGGNDFGAGSKPRGEFLAYGMDFSEIPNLNMIAGPVTVAVGGSNSVTEAIIARLRAQSPEYNWNNGAATQQGGLLAAVWTRVLLPHASVPEANPDYKYCWFIPAPTGAWWTGKLIFHFNDQVT